MSKVEVTSNFKSSDGVDLGKKLISKDYLISVYPGIGDKIGIPPELWTWGAAASGRLGNAISSNFISTPITTFAGGTNWKQVCANGSSTAAIKTDGTLWFWGQQLSGAFGNRTNAFADISTPITTFAGGNNWKQVSGGNGLTAAIKTDGTLWTWGYGNNGALGNAQRTDRSTPVTTFAGGNNWKQVSVGNSRIAAIKTDGTLWIWGYENSGQLGNARDSAAAISTPITTFAGGNNWKHVDCGSSCSAAIKTDGTLWLWGFLSNGIGGNGVSTSNRISTPITTFAGGNNWKQVSIEGSVAAIKTDGTLWTWGSGTNGRLGNAQITNRSTPITTFAGGTNWKQVSVSASTVTSAIKTDGTLWTWGYTYFGRLGNAITVKSSISTPITTFAGGNNWKQVSCDTAHAAAIKSVDFSPF